LAVDALIVEAEVSWRVGKPEEGFKAISEGRKLLADSGIRQIEENKKEIRKRNGKLLHHEGVIFWYKGDLDKALECHQQSMVINEELGNKLDLAGSFNNLGLVYWSKSEHDEALDYYKQSLAISEELDHKLLVASILNNMGNLYATRGELDLALEIHFRSLSLKEELGLEHDIALSLNNVGTIYQLKGDFDQACDFYDRSLKMHEILGIRRDMALVSSNLADIHMLRGNLDKALEDYEFSLEIYNEMGFKTDIARLLSNIGEIHRKKDNPTKAIEIYQQSLEIYGSIKDDTHTSVVLHNLVDAALESDTPSVAEKYLENLKQIDEQTDNPKINQHYRVAKANFMKSSGRARNKLEAGEILEGLIEEEVTDHSLTVTAMIHLCDLLISELKMTGEESVLKKVNDLTKRLLEIAKEQSSHSLLAKTYLLQSKLALIDLDVDKAMELLSQANVMATEKGLDMLARAVSHERDLLLSQKEKWEMIIQQPPPKKEMIDITHLDDYLELMIRRTVSKLGEEKMPSRKYRPVYEDILQGSLKSEKSTYRAGIAQIGLSESGDIVDEFYEEKSEGLFRIKKEKIDSLRIKIREMIEKASSKEIKVLLFPELTIDLSYKQVAEEIQKLAKEHDMYVIPGSYHDQKTNKNLCRVIGPDGVLWEQEKHIPANIHYQGKRIIEGIDSGSIPRETIICNTEYGRIAIAICRDFLDLDLRVELKNTDPPVDLIFNPAFTPVTSDFEAAHFDARRSIYAYCFFANVAEFGDSIIYTPEKERVERKISKGTEDLIYKEVDLFQLRSERKKWEEQQKKHRKFIQSTR
ncbi:MAG: tetratricopeptide repeat protein, partial [Candidatus Thorarchaeota archaeon]